jgi:hypothetical protein
MEKQNMKTRNLIMTIGVAALAAITINVSADQVYLTPRAQGNQIKHFDGRYNDPNLIDTWHAEVITPRAAGNQATTVAGVANDVNPAMTCARTMNGSPKAIQACIESGTMSGCSSSMTVAPLK